MHGKVLRGDIKERFLLKWLSRILATSGLHEDEVQLKKSAWRSLCKVWSRKDQLPTHQICIVFLEPQMKMHLVLVINENLFFLLYYSLRSPKEVQCQLPIAQKWWENRSVYFIRLHSQLHGFQGWESFPRSNLSNRQNTVFQATPSQSFKDRGIV